MKLMLVFFILSPLANSYSRTTELYVHKPCSRVIKRVLGIKSRTYGYYERLENRARIECRNRGGVANADFIKKDTWWKGRKTCNLELEYLCTTDSMIDEHNEPNNNNNS